MDQLIQRLYHAADIAYSEMAFAVHDLAGRRLSEEQIDYRSERLAKAADALHLALKNAAPLIHR
jgi:hypothetical protein